MAKGKKRSHKGRRRNPPASARRTAARRVRGAGVRGILRTAPHFAIEALMGAAVVTGGKIVARKVRGAVFGKQPGTIVSSLIEAGVGLAGGLALCMLGHESLGADFAKGGFQAPLETTVQQFGIPHISDSLGDDGYLMGPGTGVTLVSAFPDDYGALASDRVNGYVSGAPARPSPAQLGAYVAGSSGF